MRWNLLEHYKGMYSYKSLYLYKGKTIIFTDPEIKICQNSTIIL